MWIWNNIIVNIMMNAINTTATTTTTAATLQIVRNTSVEFERKMNVHKK